MPNAEHAIIEQGKLEGYLLSEVHPVGRFKARFFAEGPGGSAPVTSVWFVRTGEAVARFVTAYPGGKA